jgi:hypothetical protein
MFNYPLCNPSTFTSFVTFDALWLEASCIIVIIFYLINLWNKGITKVFWILPMISLGKDYKLLQVLKKIMNKVTTYM